MFGSYLMFNRSCQEALQLYVKAFGGKITKMQKYGDMPPNPNFPIKEEDRELVLNASLDLGDLEIMCADSSGRNTAGDNMYLTFTVKDSEKVQQAWDILKEGGEIYMDLAPAFFADLHGSLRDKFGVNWMFTALK